MIDKDIVNTIRAEIASTLSDSDIFAAVYAFPKSTLEGYPAAVIMPSENLADYATTFENRFVFSFNVHIYYPSQKEADLEKTELAVGEAIGEVLSIFSARNVLASCDWVEPIPSIWGDTTVGEATYRTGQVVLRCIKYVDVR